MIVKAGCFEAERMASRDIVRSGYRPVCEECMEKNSHFYLIENKNVMCPQCFVNWKKDMDEDFVYLLYCE